MAAVGWKRSVLEKRASSQSPRIYPRCCVEQGAARPAETSSPKRLGRSSRVDFCQLTEYAPPLPPHAPFPRCSYTLLLCSAACGASARLCLCLSSDSEECTGPPESERRGRLFEVSFELSFLLLVLLTACPLGSSGRLGCSTSTSASASESAIYSSDLSLLTLKPSSAGRILSLCIAVFYFAGTATFPA